MFEIIMIVAQVLNKLTYLIIDCIGIFAFIFRSPTDTKEKLAIFRLINNEDMMKDEILKKFTKCLAENACSADSVIAQKHELHNRNMTTK